MKRLSSLEKAAILMIAFGEELASEIFKNLDLDEVRNLAQTMKRLPKVDEATVHEILMEFQENLSKNPGPNPAGFADKVLEKAFGSDIAGQLGLGNSPALKCLDSFTPEHLARFLTKEHPQTSAVIMAHLPPEKLAITIKSLPVARQSAILLRLAALESVAPEILEDIESSLQQELASQTQSHKIDGLDKVVKMLSQMDSESANKMIEDIRQRDPKLAAAIDEQRFTFTHFADIDPPAMQKIISKIDVGLLAIALRGAAAGVAENFYLGMSKRAAERLRQDIQEMPKMRLDQVEDARRSIIKTAKELDAAGEINLDGGQTV